MSLVGDTDRDGWRLQLQKLAGIRLICCREKRMHENVIHYDRDEKGRRTIAWAVCTKCKQVWFGEYPMSKEQKDFLRARKRVAP